MLKLLAEFFRKFEIEPEIFERVKREVNESNRKGLLVFSGVTALVLCVLYYVSSSSQVIGFAMRVYLVFGLLQIAVFAFSLLLLPKFPDMTEPLVYVFMIFILIFGILMGAMDNPASTSTVYMVLIFALPLLFTIRPFRTCLVIVLMTGIFIAIESRTKLWETFQIDMINALCFTLLSVICCIYLMALKYGRYSVEYENITLKDRELQRERDEKLLIYKKTYIDSLTGLLNRTAFNEDFAAIQQKEAKELTFVSIDVNGLKTVNDLYGHQAGDELLSETARCLEEVFENFGKQYRMGGDEFLSILKIGPDELKNCLQSLRKKLEIYDSENIHGISVSCGTAAAKENPKLSLTELEKLADGRMYEDKNTYYCQRGIDRRSIQSFYEVICHSYLKILKVDLTDSLYTALQVQENEMVPERGFSAGIYEWLKDFALTGQVAPEDREEFLKCTSKEYLQSYFAQGNKLLTIYYRRKSGDTFKKAMMEMIPADEYSHDHQKIYLFVKNIEK